MTSMTSMIKPQSMVDPKPRVLVVENDPRTAALHQQNLERWGYQPILAEGIGDALLVDAQRKAYEQACHIALLDMHLLDDHDENDKSGLDLAAKLKPTLSIILSGGGNDRKTTLEVIRKDAVDFIGKEEPLARLQEALGDAAQKMYCGKYGPLIDIAETLVTQIMNSLAPDKPEQVRDILKALFPDARVLTVELIAGSASTPSVNLCRESYVLKVNPDNRQPVIVKLSTPMKISREKQNYEKYIKDRLPSRSYAELRGLSERWHISGLAYAFLGADNQPFIRFSDYYQNASIDTIKKVLTNLFETNWANIYKRNQQNLIDRSFIQTYYEKDSGFEEWLRNSISYTADTFSCMGLHLVDPLHWLLKQIDTHKLPKVVLSRVHGDMVGSNILVDQYQNACIIDYEDVGEGHILTDFVQLEVDLLTRISQLHNVETAIFYEICLMAGAVYRPGELLKPTEKVWREPEARKVYFAIRHICELASRVTLYVDSREYLWGLLLTTVLKLREYGVQELQEKEFSSATRLRLLASILCQRLIIREQSIWPPVDWPQVKWVTVSEQEARIQMGNDLKNQLKTAEARLRNYGNMPSAGLQREIDSLRKRLHDLGEIFDVAKDGIISNS